MPTAPQSILKMDISPFGLALIRRFEGCRLTVYLDSKGLPTIGVGHLLHAPFPPGLTWTMERAMAQLGADVQGAVDCIIKAVHVPLSQPQFDAMISWIFNIGCEAFIMSTMLSLLNKKEYVEAANQLLRWVKPPELKPRREAERAVFLYGTD